MQKKQVNIGVLVILGVVGAMQLYFGSDFNTTKNPVDLFQLVVGLFMIGVAIYGWMKASKKV